MESVIPLAKGSPPVVECPECGRETVLEGTAAAGAAALPSNNACCGTDSDDDYLIVGVIAAIEQDKQSKLKHPSCQGGCAEEASSTFRCRDCGTYLCNDCCYDHSRKKATSGHTTVNLKEPSLKGPPAATGTAPASVVQAAAEAKCAKHNEPLKIYCHDHKEVICMCVVLCFRSRSIFFFYVSFTFLLFNFFILPLLISRLCATYGAHKGCKSELVMDVIAARREKMEELLGKLGTLADLVKECLAGNQAKATELKATGETVSLCFVGFM